MLNLALAPISYAGVKIVVELLGNLEMTSSQIASFNGGSITVTAGGKADIGSQVQFTSDDTPKGIYTGHGGDVSVTAMGDVNLNGSRIASYDGGDVTVTSKNGDVNAGEGGKGFFRITTVQRGPMNKPVQVVDRFFGSGIVALTGPGSKAHVGNILVAAGRDIVANAGGILQQAFNNSDISDVSVTLNAKRDIVAGQSGVLGANVKLKAGRDIKGLIVANNDLDIKAQQNVNVTALAAGNANVSGGGTVSGSVVAQGNVTVAGDTVSAAVISTGGSTSTSGDSSGAKVGAFAAVAAPTAQQTTQDAAKTVAAKATEEEDEEEKKKRAAAKGPTLVKTVGRVTVILPDQK
jgi:hypothetical protein